MSGLFLGPERDTGSREPWDSGYHIDSRVVHKRDLKPLAWLVIIGGALTVGAYGISRLDRASAPSTNQPASPAIPAQVGAQSQSVPAVQTAFRCAVSVDGGRTIIDLGPLPPEKCGAAAAQARHGLGTN